MSATGETLRPESEAGRRFIVTIVEEVTLERHAQEYRQIGTKEDGTAKMGYVTTCVRKEEKRTIFIGEFTQRPPISALAALMESAPPGAR
jgi:hypothetical protein